MNELTVHELKVWPEWFDGLGHGARMWDLRDASEREFRIGDLVTFREYEAFRETYTGREVSRRIERVIMARELPDALLQPHACLLELALPISKGASATEVDEIAHALAKAARSRKDAIQAREVFEQAPGQLFATNARQKPANAV